MFTARRSSRCCFWAAVALMVIPVLSADGDERAALDRLLEAESAPPGVIFEIAAARHDELAAALPRIRGYIEELVAAYPEIHVLVVSHGAELFALTKQQATSFTSVHGEARRLSDDYGTPVQVCGAHAATQGVAESDFPDYVGFTDSGPARINDYRALGYRVVRLRPQ